MKIVLAAVEPPLAEAWKRFCGDLDCVSVHEASILDLRVDAVVSPANSFGFMDGGIDALYSNHFGWHVQRRLQEQIRTVHHGELLVGAAEIVETDDAAIPYMIAAPTMRVPMILQNTVNPYLAARAALLLVQNGTLRTGSLAGQPISTAVQSVAFPGLGTGVGQVGFNTCARQVRAAIDDVLSESRVFPTSLADAQIRHQKLYTDRVRDLQFE
jgi:O-acetyl-ADP-ribose deacetylase (regulator of RNase III)